MKKIFVTQLSNSDLSYTLLLAFSRALHIMFRHNNFIVGLEYFTEIFIDGRTVVVEFSSDDKKAMDLFINFMDNFRPNSDDIDLATKQTAIKLNRTLKICDKEIKTAKWIDYNSLDVYYNMDDSSRHQHAAKHSFSESSIIIKINNTPDNLRGLAVLVINSYEIALWQELLDKLEDVVFLGNNWSENPSIFELAVRVRGNIDKKYLLHAIGQANIEISKRDFVKKIHKKIKDNCNDISKLLDYEKLAWFSSVVMGGKGFEKITTIENIKRVLNNIEIDVKKPRRN
jgi:hypothetical protein